LPFAVTDAAELETENLIYVINITMTLSANVNRDNFTAETSKFLNIDAQRIYVSRNFRENIEILAKTFS
jgi:hypothetical protein